jgi:glycosyltransferase involved in cell wall biosynthesis
VTAPRVSVITSTFNAGKAVGVTARSLEVQTSKDFEWIVIDGGSTDSTLEVLRAHAGVIRHLQSEPDQGIYDAWNKGVGVARGEWIAFIGAGDSYRPDAVERYLARIDELQEQRSSPLQYVSSRVQMVSGERGIRVFGRPWNWRAFRIGMCVAHVGSMHHRSLFADGRRFDTSYRITGDYEFLLRQGAQLRAGFLDHVTASMEVGGISDSLLRATEEAARAQVETGARHRVLARLHAYRVRVTRTVRRALWY